MRNSATWICSSVVILVLLLAPSGAFAFQNEPDGFRSYKWGQSIDALAEMECKGWLCSELRSIKTVREDFDYKAFEKKGEELRLGSVLLYSIRYYTWQDSLRGVVLSAPSKNRDAILGILNGRFGKGTKEKNASIRREAPVAWEGKKTTIRLQDDGIVCEVIMTSVEIEEKEKAFRRTRSVKRLVEQIALDNAAITKGEGF